MYLLSPSQAKTFQGCQRKWAYDKLALLPREDKPWFKFGKELHEHLENVTLGTQDPDEVPEPYTHLVQSAVASGLMPPPGTPVEVTLARTLTRDLILQARADALIPTEYGALVLDYKTTSKRKSKWVLSSLKEDMQAMCNAWLAYETYGFKEVRARWVYLLKKTKRNCVWAHESADELLPRKMVNEYIQDVVVPLANKVTGYRRHLPVCANDVPRNLDHCDLSGNFCDFADHCLRVDIHTGPKDR